MYYQKQRMLQTTLFNKYINWLYDPKSLKNITNCSMKNLIYLLEYTRWQIWGKVRMVILFRLKNYRHRIKSIDYSNWNISRTAFPLKQSQF